MLGIEGSDGCDVVTATVASRRDSSSIGSTGVTVLGTTPELPGPVG